jgi:hypothetical protein
MTKNRVVNNTEINSARIAHEQAEGLYFDRIRHLDFFTELTNGFVLPEQPTERQLYNYNRGLAYLNMIDALYADFQTKLQRYEDLIAAKKRETLRRLR